MSTIISAYAESAKRGKYSINLDYDITYSSGVATITVNYIWLKCLSAGYDLTNSRIGRAATNEKNPNYITINNVKKKWYFGKISCGANGAANDDVNNLNPQIECYGGKNVNTGVAPSSPGTTGLGLSWNITLLNNNTLITSVPLKLEWVTGLGGSTAVFDKDNSWALDSSTIGIEAQVEFAGASILTLNDVTEYQFGTTVSTYPTVTINKTINNNTDKLQYRIGKNGSWTNVTSYTADPSSVSLQTLLTNAAFQNAAYAAMGATQSSITLEIRSITKGASVPAQGQATNIVKVTLKAANEPPTCKLSSQSSSQPPFKYKILGTSSYQTISASGTTVFTHPNNIYSLELDLEAFNGAYIDSLTLLIDGAELEKDQNFNNNSSVTSYKPAHFNDVNSYNLTGKQLTYKITDTRKRSASGTLVTISQLSPYVSPSAEITLNKSFLDLDILTGTVKFKVNFNQPINNVSALGSIKIYDSNITDLSNITSTTTPIYSATISNSQLNRVIYTSKYSSNNSTTADQYDYRIDSNNHRLVRYTTGTTIDARTIYYQLSEPDPIDAPSRNTYSGSIEFAIPQTTSGTTFRIKVTDIFGNSASTDLTVFAEPVFDWGSNDFQFNVPAVLNKGGTLKPYRFVNIDDYCSSTLHHNEKLNYFLSIAMYACPEGLSVLYTNNGSVQLPKSENAGNADYTDSTSGKNAWNGCEAIVLRRRSGMSDIVSEYSLDTTVLLFHKNKIAYNYATAITPDEMPDKSNATEADVSANWQGWKVLDLNTLSNISSLPHISSGTATPTSAATEGDIYFKYTN